MQVVVSLLRARATAFVVRTAPADSPRVRPKIEKESGLGDPVYASCPRVRKPVPSAGRSATLLVYSIVYNIVLDYSIACYTIV